jgi:hypothetical protein
VGGRGADRPAPYPDLDLEQRFPAREDDAVAFCRRPVLDRATWSGPAPAPVALVVPTVGVPLAGPLAYGEHRRVDYLLDVHRVPTLPRALVAAGGGVGGAWGPYAASLRGRLAAAVARRLVDPGPAGSDGTPAGTRARRPRISAGATGPETRVGTVRLRRVTLPGTRRSRRDVT